MIGYLPFRVLADPPRFVAGFPFTILPDARRRMFRVFVPWVRK